MKKLVVVTILVNLLIGANGVAQSEIQFPIEVGTKPESITKGFNDNYYVTLPL